MNRELLDSCTPLKGYSVFVDKVRKNSLSMPLEEGVDRAVQECIKDGILRDVLSEERAAVMLEMLTEFDEKLYEEGLREEGREEMCIEKDKEIAAKDAELNAKDAELNAKDAELNARDAELKRVLDWARAHGYKE